MNFCAKASKILQQSSSFIPEKYLRGAYRFTQLLFAMCPQVTRYIMTNMNLKMCECHLTMSWLENLSSSKLHLSCSLFGDCPGWTYFHHFSRCHFLSSKIFKFCEQTLSFKPCAKVAPITGTGKKELAKSFFDFLRSCEIQNPGWVSFM